jgi:RNA polymerase primary sigma factor
MPESSILNIYFKEIAKNKPLSMEREKALIKLIRNGDKKTSKNAKDELIKANLRFVASVAKKYQNQGIELEDLISVGNQGLLKALNYFDEEKNFKLISYAVWWIRQRILCNMADNSRAVRIPLQSIANINEVRKAYNKLEQECQGYVTSGDIATKINKTEKFVDRIQKIDTPAVSLNAKIYDDIELLDTLPSSSDDIEEIFQLKKKISALIETLKDNREQEVIKMYFGINYESSYTLEEIGQKYNLSRERVRQIKERALICLKKISKKIKFKEIL